MIDAIADSKKVVNHMHLPIQCGSDELLKKMNRGYTVNITWNSSTMPASACPTWS